VRQPQPPFAVELNKQLVRRPTYDTTSLNNGDVVEIVTLVGGG
jgi:thiamine biosynthesis protein ThiS